MYSKRIFLVLFLTVTILANGSLLQSLLNPARVVFGYHAATQKEKRIRAIKCVVNSLSTARQTVQLEVQYAAADFNDNRIAFLSGFSLIKNTGPIAKSNSLLEFASGNKAPPANTL